MGVSPDADADVVVVGAGAAGLAAARTAVRRRRRVVLVSDGPPGGDCTFTGCVPSKTLLAAAATGLGFAAAMHRVRATVTRVAATETAEVLGGEGIEVVEGRAKFTGPRRLCVGKRELTARSVVIATGTAPLVPPIEGVAEVDVLTNESVFGLREAPASLAVLGGGPVGCELAQAFARLGVAVTLVESAGRLLGREEPQASEVVAAALRRDGVDVRTGAEVASVSRTAYGMHIDLAGGEAVTAQRLMVAVGRRPLTAGLGLESAGVAVDDRGYVRTDMRLATTADGVYAAGDVTGRLAFTHAADEMGRLATFNALYPWLRLRFHAEAVPWVTFTDPEVARVGLTEADAADLGGRVAHLPLSEVDRAVTDDRTEGFLRLVTAPRWLSRHLGGGRLVGATIVAPHAGEMIGELALAARTGMFAGRLAQTVHPYPTYATGLRSAAAQLVTEVGGRRARPARREEGER